MFFNNSSLDVSEGYKIFLGGAPRIEDINVSVENAEGDFFKRLHFVLQKDRIREGEYIKHEIPFAHLTHSPVLPVLLDDLNRCMLDWGSECVVNPFKEVNDVSVSSRTMPCMLNTFLNPH